MHIDVLLQDRDLFSALSYALSPIPGRNQEFQMEILSNWKELERRIGKGETELAVVQPDFPGDAPGHHRITLPLERIRECTSYGQLVLYIARGGKGLTSPTYRRLRFPFLMIQGIDDHPHSILRVLARTWVFRCLP